MAKYIVGFLREISPMETRQCWLLDITFLNPGNHIDPFEQDPELNLETINEEDLG